MTDKYLFDNAVQRYANSVTEADCYDVDDFIKLKAFKDSYFNRNFEECNKIIRRMDNCVREVIPSKIYNKVIDS
jgi:hypothetical protein